MTPWKQRLDLAGTIAGFFGIVICGLAVLLRFVAGGGNPDNMVVAPRNLLLGGIAIIVTGCWLKLTAR
jgi:hypothetical protein